MGTIDSLWEANMDLLDPNVPLDVWDDDWKIYSRNSGMTGHFVSDTADVQNSMGTEGCAVEGKVEKSVLFAGVKVGKGAVVEESIVMPGAVIEEGAHVAYTIVAENVVVKKDAVVGCAKEKAEDPEKWGIAVIGEGVTIGEGAKVYPKAMVVKNVEDGDIQW